MRNNIFGETLIFANNDRSFIIDQKQRILNKLISFAYNTNSTLPADKICEKIIKVKGEIDKLNMVFNCLTSLEKKLCSDRKIFYEEYFKKKQSITDLAVKYQRSRNYFYNIKRKIIGEYLSILNSSGFTDESFIESFNQEAAIVYEYQAILNKKKRRELSE